MCLLARPMCYCFFLFYFQNGSLDIILEKKILWLAPFNTAYISSLCKCACWCNEKWLISLVKHALNVKKWHYDSLHCLQLSPSTRKLLPTHTSNFSIWIKRNVYLSGWSFIARRGKKVFTRRSYGAMSLSQARLRMKGRLTAYKRLFNCWLIILHYMVRA